jgi:hypothetical protein
MMNARTRKLMTPAAVAVLTFCLISFERPAAAARGNCKEVKGRLSEVVAGYLTAGTITNGGILNGTIESVFTSGGLPTPDPHTYSYTRVFTLTTDRGQLKLNIVGMGDYGTGLISEIGRIDAGGSTGRFAGATGALFTVGKSADGFSTAQFEITGEICSANE